MLPSMEPLILRALTDNYIYMLVHGQDACVIDPATPGPVQKVLRAQGLNLKLILSTHAHFDHVGGNQVLKRETSCEIIGGSRGVPEIDQLVKDGETLAFGGMEIQVKATPGHTRDSLSYYLPGTPGLVFTGDTLFVGGCGRLLGGTAGQLWESLGKLAELPEHTRVYCGHEYTKENLAFAVNVDPTRGELLERQQETNRVLQAGQPTVPSTIKLEKQTNVFLLAKDKRRFTELRRQKDAF